MRVRNHNWEKLHPLSGRRSLSQQNGGPIQGLSWTPRYGNATMVRGISGGLLIASHVANIRQSLGKLLRPIAVVFPVMSLINSLWNYQR